jgi:predicted SprT family Zn-dependent metalloprotease
MYNVPICIRIFISDTQEQIHYIMTKVKFTWCFRCKGKREIIDPKKSITKNNRNLYVGRCGECEGKVALMGGYATLPGLEYDSR